MSDLFESEDDKKRAKLLEKLLQRKAFRQFVAEEKNQTPVSLLLSNSSVKKPTVPKTSSLSSGYEHLLTKPMEHFGSDNGSEEEPFFSN